MRSRLHVSVAAIITTALVLHATSATSRVWQGKNEPGAAGQRRVTNPADGIYPPTTTQLEELWRIGGDSEEEGEVFGLIHGLAVDADGFVYVMDYQLSEIRMFSPEGEYARTVARQGEGPGELRRPNHLCVSSDGRICCVMGSPARIVSVTRDGDPAGTITLSEEAWGSAPAVFGMAATPEGFIIHGQRAGGMFVSAIDAEGNETDRFYEESGSGGELVWEERSRALTGRWIVTRDGRLYLVSSYEDYEVHMWDPTGRRVRTITREYEHRKRSKAEKQRVYDWATMNPNGNLPGTRFEIEDYDRDIMALYPGPDGGFRVLTSRGFYDRPPGAIGVFDHLDGDGRFVRSVTLLGEGDPFRDRYTFAGDRLYVVTCYTDALATLMGGSESRFAGMCDEPMEVICYRIGG